MFKNDLKIALRNLRKSPFFSALNVVGLSLGMSASLVVILIIRDQLSYDRFHDAPERLFRIICEQADGDKLASVPEPLGDVLERDFSVAETSTAFTRNLFNNDATASDGRILPVSGFFADADFFKIFNFKLLEGDAATALAAPDGIVLSKKMAERFFGQKNALGETLILKEKGAFRVTGVVAQPPGKTHLDFDCLVSKSALATLEAKMTAEEQILGNWENRYMTYVYVRLAAGKTETDLQKTLDLVADERRKAAKSDSLVRFFAQNIAQISPRREILANDLGGSAPNFFLYGLAFFVLILTVFPSLNYANLTVARMLERVREMGVRKAIGAGGGDLKKLIFAEAVVTSMLALVVAVLLHFPLLSAVKKYFPPQANLSELTQKGTDWLVFIAFGLVVGLLAGWIPARKMARLRPVLALRGQLGGAQKRPSRVGFRGAMLVAQFTVSMLFLIVVGTIWSQMRFMSLANYGFQKENLLTVELQNNPADRVAEAFRADARVVSVAATTVVLASNNLQSQGIKRRPGAEYENLHCAQVDENYLPTMKLDLVAGQNFVQNVAKRAQTEVLLNEKAVAHFDLGAPAEAVGKQIWLSDTASATVVGVLRDFHYRNFENQIEPFGLISGAPDSWLLQVRVAAGDPIETLAALERIWKKIDPAHPFQAKFMEDSMEEGVQHVAFVGSLASFFGLLSVALACMGLLGSVTQSVSLRVKEIGVRKTLGASVAQVTALLSRRFLALLGLGLAIALPLGLFFGNLILGLFAYRIQIGGLILGGSAAILIGLGLLTVGVQAGRAALADPVKSLRSE